MILGPNQELLLKTWETTELPQTRRVLHRWVADDCPIFGGPIGYCCLGIGCVLFEIPETRERNISNFGDGSLCPIELKSMVKFAPLGVSQLMILNDANGLTFKQIAEKVRAQPELFFSEPA